MLLVGISHPRPAMKRYLFAGSVRSTPDPAGGMHELGERHLHVGNPRESALLLFVDSKLPDQIQNASVGLAQLLTIKIVQMYEMSFMIIRVSLTDSLFWVSTRTTHATWSRARASDLLNRTVNIDLWYSFSVEREPLRELRPNSGQVSESGTLGLPRKAANKRLLAHALPVCTFACSTYEKFLPSRFDEAWVDSFLSRGNAVNFREELPAQGSCFELPAESFRLVHTLSPRLSCARFGSTSAPTVFLRGGWKCSLTTCLCHSFVFTSGAGRSGRASQRRPSSPVRVRVVGIDGSGSTAHHATSPAEGCSPVQRANR